MADATKDMLEGSEVVPGQQLVEPTWNSFMRVFITMLEQKHPYTQGHSRRVQRYVNLLTNALGWDDYRRQCASVAALLHDIGKMIVDRTTLDNPHRMMTPMQREELLDHPYNGAQIAAPFFPEEVVLGILQHHERVDGNMAAERYPAYPLGTHGASLTLIARVIAVCDAFDAMTTQRSYHKPVPKQTAAELLLDGAGSRHDKEYTALFVARVVPAIEVSDLVGFTE